MNEMDLLNRFRDEVPPGISPRAEDLFFSSMKAERPVVPAQRQSRVQRLRRPAMIFTPVVAGVAAAAVVAAMLTGSQAPAGSPVLTAKLLADRTAATVLADPEVSPGQLVYLKELWETPTGPHSAEQEIAQAQWQTADDSVAYYGGGGYVISEGPVRRPTLAIQRGSVRSGHAGQRAWQH